MKKVIILTMVALLTATVGCKKITPSPSSCYTDNRTGLMWVKDGNSAGCNNGNTLSWESALSFCENLSYAGHTDWRLPTLEELKSIIDSTTSDPVINVTYFPNTKSSDYWSSTTYVANTSRAWNVDFTYGHVYYPGKANNVYYMRPVRAGQ